MVSLDLGGFVPFSTVDFPGRLAAVLFCRGCDWHCPYCHNAHLRDAPALAWGRVQERLEGRRGLLEGVVISGGEPLLQTALSGAVLRIRELGFEAALHTGGARVETFRQTLPHLSWVGFDLKAPFDRYEAVTGVPGSGSTAQASLLLLRESGVAFEVRTTVAPGLLSLDDLREMAAMLARFGIPEWTLQAFRAEGCRDPGLASRKAIPLAGIVPCVAPAALGLEIRIREAPSGGMAPG